MSVLGFFRVRKKIRNFYAIFRVPLPSVLPRVFIDCRSKKSIQIGQLNQRAPNFQSHVSVCRLEPAAPPFGHEKARFCENFLHSFFRFEKAGCIIFILFFIFHKPFLPQHPPPHPLPGSRRPGGVYRSGPPGLPSSQDPGILDTGFDARVKKYSFSTRFIRFSASASVRIYEAHVSPTFYKVLCKCWCAHFCNSRFNHVL